MSKRLLELGWQILELKFAYYCTEDMHSDWAELIQPDSVYDLLEAEYKVLCAQEGVKPTASEYVGFPHQRPCGQLVRSKLVCAKE